MPRFIKDDPDEFAEYLRGIGRGLVALDGWPNAGKSTLAKEMAKRLSCVAAVEADDFFPNAADTDYRGREVPHEDRLRINDLHRAIKAKGPLVLLDSVCAVRVLDRLELSATAVVWVHWAGHTSNLEQLCRDFFDLDDPGPNLGSRSPLLRDVRAYIASHHPKCRANVIYLNAWREPNP